MKVQPIETFQSKSDISTPRDIRVPFPRNSFPRGARRRSGLPRFVSCRPLTLFGSFSSCFNTVYIF